MRKGASRSREESESGKQIQGGSLTIRLDEGGIHSVSPLDHTIAPNLFMRLEIQDPKRTEVRAPFACSSAEAGYSPGCRAYSFYRPRIRAEREPT